MTKTSKQKEESFLEIFVKTINPMNMEDKLEKIKKSIVDCEILLRKLDKKSKILTLNIDTSIMTYKKQQ